MIVDLEKKYEKGYQKLIKKLWNDIEENEIKDIIQYHYLGKEKIFVKVHNDKVIAFVNTSIRNDYVEGSDSSKVGYIEGIYVSEKYRRMKIARELINTCVVYFKEIGVTQIGSDTELENKQSQNFHKAIGFKEVSTIKHYIMNIGNEIEKD